MIETNKIPLKPLSRMVHEGKDVQMGPSGVRIEEADEAKVYNGLPGVR